MVELKDVSSYWLDENTFCINFDGRIDCGLYYRRKGIYTNSNAEIYETINNCLKALAVR